MRWKEYVDPDEVRKAIAILQEENGVFEVRVIGTAKRDIISGYFRDAETLLKQFDNVDLRRKNVYVTLGEVKKECIARAQSERFLQSPQTSSDTDILRYRWLFVDLDPIRTVGISSTDTELKSAEKLAIKVDEYMRTIGFHEPVKAMSGNGVHLLYRIDIKNDHSGNALIEKCLKVLADLFSDGTVKIDTTNSNPSRICKLHGTLAQKGTSTAERPYRMSRIVSVPDIIQINGSETLEALAGELPDSEPEQPHRGRGYQTTQQSFDLLEFMSRHGMTYTEDENDRAKIYKLDECPFDPSHKNGDAKIFYYRNGAIAFKCHHDHCKMYRWQDVRLKFEPDAYNQDKSDERIDAGYRKHIQQTQQEKADSSDALIPIEENRKKLEKKEPRIRKLKTAEDLMQKNLPEPKVFIGTGEELPFLVEGTCILSAKPKLGKSWLALSMCVAVAKGEDFLGYHTEKCSTLYLDLETSEQLQQKRLKKVLHDEPVPKNFYLDTETNTLSDGFVEQIEAYLAEDPGIGVVVIDVFQIIRTPSKNMKESEYEHAYRDITPLNELAQKHHISIILVCHDRKAVDPDDPFSNILGSTGLQGAATQMMVMFRSKKNDPIHISVKGKTIDGLPELNVKLENAKWSVVEGINTADREKMEMEGQYLSSPIREAVIQIANHNTLWKGRCSALVNDAAQFGVAVKDSNRNIGGFLHKYQGYFLDEDNILISIIDNGSASKIYGIQHSTIHTIHENDDLPFMDYEEARSYGLSEKPFP